MASKRNRRIKKELHRLASGKAGGGWAAKRAAKIMNRRNHSRFRSPNRKRGGSIRKK